MGETPEVFRGTIRQILNLTEEIPAGTQEMEVVDLRALQDHLGVAEPQVPPQVADPLPWRK